MPYAPLNPEERRIRLLKVEPSADGDDAILCCSLWVAALTPDLGYMALSYVWGNPRVTTEILVNNKPLQVTKNLAAALRQFRKSRMQESINGMPVWIDAICINQSNVSERSHHVRMMGSIYAHANAVLSWLGPPDDTNLDLAFELIEEHSIYWKAARELGYKPESESSLAPADLHWLRHRPDFHLRDTDRGTRNKTWNSIISLNDHVYWTRVWIVQEVALAWASDHHFILCGEKGVTFEDLQEFQSFVERLRRYKTPKPEFFSQIVWESIVAFSPVAMGMMNMLRHLKAVKLRGDAMDVAFVPFLSAQCASTDPRDAVYGLYGLLKSEAEPDYSTPARRVYEDLVEIMLRRKQFNNVLCFAGIIYEDIEQLGLPSWVPKLNTLRDDAYHVTIGTGVKRPWLDDVSPDGPRIIADGVLGIRGIRLDQCIKTIKMGHYEELDDLLEQFWWFCVEYVAGHDEDAGNAGLLPLEAVLVALCKGKDAYGRNLEIPIPVDCPTANGFRMVLSQGQPTGEINELIQAFGFPSIVELCEALDRTFTLAKNEDVNAIVKRMFEPDSGDTLVGYYYIQNSLRGWCDRMLFRTEQGHLGLGPPGVSSADVVCLLECCTLPVVMRLLDDQWVLVGSCYIYGYSDGEPMEMLKDGRFQLEEFRLH
ncbi:heterokaryon incompatibility protein-domain-containing protein [Xylariales sp. AK1849]|nr:heterokaryon incompatibility protein-domain-containing protein [Xylariales sp. AK1849]